MAAILQAPAGRPCPDKQRQRAELLLCRAKCLICPALLEQVCPRWLVPHSCDPRMVFPCVGHIAHEVRDAVFGGGRVRGHDERRREVHDEPVALGEDLPDGPLGDVEQPGGFTDRTPVKSTSVYSVNGLATNTPALLTSVSTRPNFATALPIMRSVMSPATASSSAEASGSIDRVGDDAIPAVEGSVDQPGPDPL
jgi:hypothetical protein